ncbi:MAG: methyltransferase domain-containing protein [Pseudomonadota bacterium]
MDESEQCAQGSWAGALGQSWAARVEAMHRQLAPMAEIGLAALAPQPGERVLDLGSGGGETSRMIAEAVGPGGRVTGIDISPELVEIARAAGAGLPQLSFVLADAGAHDFGETRFDALFSRFGCMFFDEAEAAFANLHTALSPGARAVFVVYTDIAENPWAAVPAQAAEAVLGPAPPRKRGAAGPFGWSDPDFFAPILKAGGFADIAWEPRALSVEVGYGDDPDPAVRAAALMLRIGTVARRLQDAPEGAEAALAPVLAEAARPYVSDGAVRLGARVWVVTARA